MNIKMLKAAVVGLVLSVSGFANAGLIVYGDDVNSFNSDDSFGLINNSGLDISNVTLSFTNGTSVWDSNLPNQPANSFLVNLASDFTGFSATFINPEPGSIADFDGFLSLSLSFTDFNIGESFIFGADIDGSPSNTGGLGGALTVDVLFSNGSIGSSVLQFVSGELISSEVNPTSVPEPTTLAIFALGLMGLAARRFKKQ